MPLRTAAPLVLVLVLVAFACAERAPARPNVLVVLCDQLRSDVLGSAGDPHGATPHLDRLAAEGARFSRAVSQSPRCSPCRASLQTGRYPHANGVRLNGDRLPDEEVTLAEHFAAAGYATGYAGKWGLDGDAAFRGRVGGWVPPGRRQGWQEWHGYEKGHHFLEPWRFDESQRPPRPVPVEGYGIGAGGWEPAWHTDLALDFARRHGEAGRPWLFFLSYGPPHHPEEAPPEFLARYADVEFELPPGTRALGDGERAELQRIQRVYYAQVAAVDHEVGRLLGGLEALGLARDTVVLFTSDHGDTLGSHAAETEGLRGKGVPFRSALEVPLIVRWPAAVSRGGVHETLAASVDVLPTLLELAGLERPAAIQGRSLAGWCREGAGADAPAVYLALEHAREEAWRAVWDGRFLLSTLRYRHLFDHRDDPHEQRDLLGEPEWAAVERRLGAELLRLARALGDPLLPTLEAELRAMDVVGAPSGS